MAMSKNSADQNLIGNFQVANSFAQHIFIIARFNFQKPDFAIRKVFNIQSIRHLDNLHYFIGSNHFRVNNEVQTERSQRRIIIL